MNLESIMPRRQKSENPFAINSMKVLEKSSLILYLLKICFYSI